jgi:hypothetical protein
LENRQVRIEIDRATGTIRRLHNKTTGEELIAADSHTFYSPDSVASAGRSVRVLAGGPLRGCLEIDVALRLRDGRVCGLVTRLWLDTEQSVVDFETTVTDPPDFSGYQWRNHLGVRFHLPTERTTVQASHFNVLEPFNREQVISPNVLLADGAGTGVVFLNEGNEFYLHQGTTISNILVVQNEPARRFRYAVGVAAANPLMQARSWYQPVFVVPAVTADQSGAPATDRPSGTPAVSLLAFDSPDVELLSCRWEEGALRVRLANTAGHPVSTRLTAFLPIVEAEETSLDGRNATNGVITDGGVKLSLRPWDIKQLRVRVRSSADAATATR